MGHEAGAETAPERARPHLTATARMVVTKPTCGTPYKSFGRPKELHWIHLQGNGQPPKNLEAYIELSLLNLAEIAPAHLSLQGKLVL